MKILSKVMQAYLHFGNIKIAFSLFLFNMCSILASVNFTCRLAVYLITIIVSVLKSYKQPDLSNFTSLSMLQLILADGSK